MSAFVASQVRSNSSSRFAADLDDSDDSDNDSDDSDEPKIRPVYRTQSGRGIRMRAADRACAESRLPKHTHTRAHTHQSRLAHGSPLCERVQRRPAEAWRFARWLS